MQAISMAMPIAGSLVHHTQVEEEEDDPFLSTSHANVAIMQPPEPAPVIDSCIEQDSKECLRYLSGNYLTWSSSTIPESHSNVLTPPLSPFVIDYAPFLRQRRFMFHLEGIPYNEALISKDRPYLSVRLDPEVFRRHFLQCTEHSHELLILQIETAGAKTQNLPPSAGFVIQLTTAELKTLGHNREIIQKTWFNAELPVITVSNQRAHTVVYHGLCSLDDQIPEDAKKAVLYRAKFPSIRQFEWYRHILTKFKSSIKMITNQTNFAYVKCPWVYDNKLIFPNPLSYHIHENAQSLGAKEVPLDNEPWFRLGVDQLMEVIQQIRFTFASDHDFMLSARHCRLDETQKGLLLTLTPINVVAWNAAIEARDRSTTSMWKSADNLINLKLQLDISVLIL